MDIAVIDDERLALEALHGAVKEACPEASVFPFRRPGELLEFAANHPLQIVFADIEMRKGNGLELVKKLKTISPCVNIIFVTGHSQYALEAFSLRVSGYLMKPVTAAAVLKELENLRTPLPWAPFPGRLRIQTFGNFEVFYGKEPVHFGRAKAKELFAYLIDRRGASSSMAEIAEALWEGEPYNRARLKQIHTCIAEIRGVLEKAGAKDILIKTRNSVAVDVTMLDCDYYQFLQGDMRAVNSFAGEYMSNYSWAEFTVGTLTMLSGKS